MPEVAEFIARVALRKETPKQVAADVTEFRREFSTIHYCFTPDYPAYKFHELV